MEVKRRRIENSEIQLVYQRCECVLGSKFSYIDIKRVFSGPFCHNVEYFRLYNLSFVFKQFTSQYKHITLFTEDREPRRYSRLQRYLKAATTKIDSLMEDGAESDGTDPIRFSEGLDFFMVDVRNLGMRVLGNSSQFFGTLLLAQTLSTDIIHSLAAADMQGLDARIHKLEQDLEESRSQLMLAKMKLKALEDRDDNFWMVIEAIGSDINMKLVDMLPFEEVAVYMKVLDENILENRQVLEKYFIFQKHMTEADAGSEKLCLLRRLVVTSMYTLDHGRFNFAPKVLAYVLPFLGGNVTSSQFLHFAKFACDISMHYTMRTKVEEDNDRYIEYFLARSHGVFCVFSDDNYNTEKVILQGKLKNKSDQYNHRCMRLTKLIEYKERGYGLYDGHNHLYENMQLFTEPVLFYLTGYVEKHLKPLEFYPFDDHVYKLAFTQRGALSFGIAKCDCKKIRDVLPQTFEILKKLKSLNPKWKHLLLRYGVDHDYYEFICKLRSVAYDAILEKLWKKEKYRDMKLADLMVITRIMNMVDSFHQVDSIYKNIENHQYWKLFLLKLHFYLTGRTSLPTSLDWGFTEHTDYLVALMKAASEMKIIEKLSEWNVSSSPFEKVTRNSRGKGIAFERWDFGLLKEMFQRLLVDIIPTAVNFIPMLLANEENVVLGALAKMLMTNFYVGGHQYELDIFRVLQSLLFRKSCCKKDFRFLIQYLAFINSKFTEGLHCTVQNLLHKNNLKSEKRTDNLLKNGRGIEVGKPLLPFLGIIRKATFHLKYQVPEKYVIAAKRALCELFELQKLTHSVVSNLNLDFTSKFRPKLSLVNQQVLFRFYGHILHFDHSEPVTDDKYLRSVLFDENDSLKGVFSQFSKINPFVGGLLQQMPSTEWDCSLGDLIEYLSGLVTLNSGMYVQNKTLRVEYEKVLSDLKVRNDKTISLTNPFSWKEYELKKANFAEAVRKREFSNNKRLGELFKRSLNRVNESNLKSRELKSFILDLLCDLGREKVASDEMPNFKPPNFFVNSKVNRKNVQYNEEVRKRIVEMLHAGGFIKGTKTFYSKDCKRICDAVDIYFYEDERKKMNYIRNVRAHERKVYKFYYGIGKPEENLKADDN